MENLIRVGAFDGVAAGRSRRQLLWELKEIEELLPPRTASHERRSHRPSSRRRAAVVTGPPRGSGAIAGNRLGDAPHTPRDPSTDPVPPLMALPGAAAARCPRWTSAPA